MTEYIERQKVRELINTNLSGLLAQINAIPTADVVPVVRCRECKYSELSIDGETRWCNNADKWVNEVTVLDDDFCSYGRRAGAQAKIATTCRHCAYGFNKSGCTVHREGCYGCKMYDKLVKCKCLEIKHGEKCPYFVEEDA